jgi:hypothetical protein
LKAIEEMKGSQMRVHLLSGFLALTLCSLASSASAALLIRVDKSTQTLVVTRDGQTLHRWPVSTGRTGFATPSGNFTTFRMEAEHFSKEWDDAPMPHSVFFTKQGHAIHGSFDTKRLGSPASHGCVRLAPANAARLFALVKQEGLPNTQVVLTGSEQVALDRAKLGRVAGGERSPPDRLSRDLRTGIVRFMPPRPSSAEPRREDDVEPLRYSTKAYEQPGFPRPYYSADERYQRSYPLPRDSGYADPYVGSAFAPF